MALRQKLHSERCPPRGFTLVELLITVAIVAILATIAYPSYLSFMQKAKRADAHSAITALQLAQARGVVLASLAGAGLDVAEYAPAAVKKAVTGKVVGSKSASKTPSKGKTGTSSKKEAEGQGGDAALDIERAHHGGGPQGPAGGVVGAEVDHTAGNCEAAVAAVALLARAWWVGVVVAGAVHGRVAG